MNLLPSHAPDLGHHVSQGTIWLASSQNGQHSAFLSYAALELRLAVERLALHYWRLVLNRPFTRLEMEQRWAFQSVVKQIYKLAGHQRVIDRHFEVMQILLTELKTGLVLTSPNLGALAACWHDCSALCHIEHAFALASHHPGDEAFKRLTAIEHSLMSQVRNCTWPQFVDPSFLALRDGYVKGAVTADSIRSWIQEKGLWATVEHEKGGSKQFFGTAVPPSGGNGGA